MVITNPTKIDNILALLNGYEGSNIWQDLIIKLPGLEDADPLLDREEWFVVDHVLFRFEPSYGEWITMSQDSYPGNPVINNIDAMLLDDEDEDDGELGEGPKMITAVIIKPEGTVTVSKIRTDLHSLRQAIGGGYLERVACSPTVSAWMDEEGKINSLPPNPLATMIVKALGWPGDGYLLNGTVMITGDKGSDVTDVPDDIVTALSDHFG